ncbi:MAG: xanthine dehydrogenase family protein subunit M [Chloroflexota bacterium]|nr:xanthine dehydrogenase family protein subunit M [Chloroflexota bacterium]
MHPFQYHEPQTLQEAATLLTDDQGGAAHIIAGGSDLIDEIKEGIISPASVVSLVSVPGLAGIAETGAGLSIGAMTTIADVAAHPVIRAAYTSLAEAAGGLATPQIRNVGTLGGNLNQRPRCWYYRHPLTQCLKKGGDRCFALVGNTKYLCVTGGDRCYIVHPSDTAVALSVFDASIEVSGGAGSRALPIGAFFAGPGVDVLRETVLEPGEFVSGVTLPRPADLGADGLPPRSLYLKAREREAGDFALVSVAVRLGVADGTVRQAAVALGGVAPVPYRATQVEEYLVGRAVSEVDAAHAGSLSIPDARPMTDNGYKVIMANNLVKQGIARLLEG